MQTVNVKIEKITRLQDSPWQAAGSQWKIAAGGQEYTVDRRYLSPDFLAYLQKISDLDVFAGLEVQLRFADTGRLLAVSLPRSSLAALARVNPDYLAERFAGASTAPALSLPDSLPQSVYEAPPLVGEYGSRKVVKGTVSWDANDDAFNRYDGDTFFLPGLGMVRLWGLDAPEIPRWDEGQQKFAVDAGKNYEGGYAARDFLRSLVAGKEVIFDVDTFMHFSGRLAGQDAYGRWVGVAYARDEAGRWVNVNKAILAAGHAEPYIFVDETGRVPSNFDFAEYYNVSRRPSQPKAGFAWDAAGTAVNGEEFAEDEEGLPPGYFKLGDVELVVPPESIKVSRLAGGERIPLLRSRSSISTGSGHFDVQVELTVYFKDEDGINGVPREENLPNGQKIVYHMNGLRALVAQYLRCPFLPVQNETLNVVYGIEALTLARLEVSTVPGFPVVFVANLVFYAFDYTLYLPQAFGFAECFNWPLFRYYYQSALRPARPYAPDTDRRGHLFLAPFEAGSITPSFSILDEDGLKARQQARLYLNKHRESTPSEFLKKNADTLPKVDRDILRDYWRLQEMRDEWKEIQAMKEKYAQTKDPRDNPQYKYAQGAYGHGVFRFYRYEPTWDEEFMELPIENGGTAWEITRRFPGKFPWLQSGPNPVDIITDDGHVTINAFLLRVKMPGMKGYSAADAIIPQIIENKARSTKDLAEVTRRFEEERETYKRMQELANSPAEEDALLEEWPIENLTITGVTVAYENNIVPVQVQLAETPAHQYLGAGDVYIRLTVETDDENALFSLHNLIRRASYLVREYRWEISDGFLAFNHPLVQLFGVKYVTVSEVVAQPVEPGVHRIDLLLVAYDRYKARAESPQKAGETGFTTYKDPQHRQQEVIDYWKVNEDLSKIELYPDLELPTLEELRAAGFWRDADTRRVYPDPDFYILYTEESVGDIVKEAFGQELKGSYSDAYGGKATVTNPVVAEGALRPGKMELNERARSMNAETARTYGAPAEPVAAPTAPSRKKYSFDESNPSKKEIQAKLDRLGEEYGVPAYVLRALVETENELYLQFYSQDPKVNKAWLGDVSYVERPNIPVMTYVEGGRVRHSTDDSLANLRRMTGVGLMQINTSNYDDLAEIERIARSVDYNLEKGVQILLGYYKEVSAYAEPGDDRWLKAILRYKGYRPEAVRNPDGIAVTKKIREAFRAYSGAFRAPALEVSPARDYDDYQSGAEEAQPKVARGQKPSDIWDSFYRATEDLRKHDARGRLIRAFPTFLLILIDEGTRINTYRLHDNFYSYQAISSIGLHRSRKIAADLLKIKLSNVFGNLDTNPDATLPEEKTWAAEVADLFRSLMQAPIRELEKRRSEEQDQLYLRTGARIHLRMGYNGDASALPVVFNGTVTRILPGEEMEITAQGDGVELINKLPWQPGEHVGALGFLGDWMGLAPEPRDFLYNLLTYNGGYFKRILNSLFPGIANANPLGIAHLGDPGKQPLFFWQTPEEQESQIMENIYAATSEEQKDDPDLGFLSPLIFGREDEIGFELQLFDKTVWDVLQIYAAATPDFIAVVHPFQFRSTIFFGKPHWDIIYDYRTLENRDGKLVVDPLKKPYRQLHIYHSLSDIIDNSIYATDRDMKTCVIGTYLANVGGTDELKTLSPVWVDTDIYPEKQRTAIVDTNIYVGGVKALQSIPILKYVPNLLNWVDRKAGNGPKVAMRVATSALKDYVRDMYQGGLLVVGDPTVKPYDTMYLLDIFNEMSGVCDVKAVTHLFSFETGYVTEIQPDAAVAIQDKGIVTFWSMFNNLTSYVAVRTTVWAAARALKYGGNTPVLNALLQIARRSQGKIASVWTSEAVQGLLAKIKDRTVSSELASAFTRWAKELGESKSVRSTVDFFKDLARMTSRSAKSARAAAAGAVAVGGAISLPAVAAVVAEMAIVYVATEAIGNVISNALANRQALKIAVLRQHGKEFSAGINGHRGAVYGDSADTITKIFNNKIVRFLMEFGLNVDVYSTSITFQPFEEQKDPAEYLGIVQQAADDLVKSEILSRQSAIAPASRPSARPAPSARTKSLVLPQDVHRVLTNIRGGSPMVDVSLGSDSLPSIRDYPYLRDVTWQAIKDVGTAVYDHFRKNILITCGYRPPGRSEGWHATGYAVDIDIPGQYEDYRRSASGRLIMTSQEGRAWLSFLVEQLVRTGFFEIIINDDSVVNYVRELYAAADVRYDVKEQHQNHVHCVYTGSDLG